MNKKLSKEENEIYCYDNEYIKLKVPKYTEVMIVTTISDSKMNGRNIITKAYLGEELEKIED